MTVRPAVLANLVSEDRAKYKKLYGAEFKRYYFSLFPIKPCTRILLEYLVEFDIDDFSIDILMDRQLIDYRNNQ